MIATLMLLMEIKKHEKFMQMIEPISYDTNEIK